MFLTIHFVSIIVPISIKTCSVDIYIDIGNWYRYKQEELILSGFVSIKISIPVTNIDIDIYIDR